MIDWYTPRSHGTDKFFSKVIGFGAVLHTHRNLIGRQKSDALLVDAERCSPHVVIWRPSDPKLRKMAELRPSLRVAEQFDAPIQNHPIPGPDVRLEEPKASAEIINGGDYSAPYGSYSWPR
jgi:hypothetical protein